MAGAEVVLADIRETVDQLEEAAKLLLSKGKAHLSAIQGTVAGLVKDLAERAWSPLEVPGRRHAADWHWRRDSAARGAMCDA